MRRSVTSSLRCRLHDEVEAELLVAVSSVHERVDEQLDVTLDGRPVDVVELATPVGGRMHVLRAGPGQLDVRYRASVTGRAEPVPVEALDATIYRRPSRYAESDRLLATATAEFGHLQAHDDLLAAISSWVGTRLRYVPGSSDPTDGAVETLLDGAGVCRDYAHLAVALLRALDVPARLVSVYAPGLAPMDFHAVAEALVDGAWHVVDATTLAPRSSLVRIATGRDAADTAFLTSYGTAVDLEDLSVSAVVDGTLPDDDVRELVSLG